MQQRRYWMQLGSLLRAQRDISATVTTSALATTDIVSIAIASATNASAVDRVRRRSDLGLHRWPSLRLPGGEFRLRPICRQCRRVLQSVVCDDARLRARSVGSKFSSRSIFCAA